MGKWRQRPHLLGGDELGLLEDVLDVCKLVFVLQGRVRAVERYMVQHLYYTLLQSKHCVMTMQRTRD